MRNRWCVILLLFAGCFSMPTGRDENATQQVGSTPFTEPNKPAPTKVSYTAAPREISERAVQMLGKLLGDNPQTGLTPFGTTFITAISSPDPEIFHKGQNYIYITDTLVKKCDTDALLAAVLANELGKMVAEREKSVADQIRAPSRCSR